MPAASKATSFGADTLSLSTQDSPSPLCMLQESWLAPPGFLLGLLALCLIVDEFVDFSVGTQQTLHTCSSCLSAANKHTDQSISPPSPEQTNRSGGRPPEETKTVISARNSLLTTLSARNLFL